MVDYITVGVVAIVVVFAAAVFYKALKEPVDLVLLGLMRLGEWFKDQMTNVSSKTSSGYEEIRYG